MTLKCQYFIIIPIFGITRAFKLELPLQLSKLKFLLKVPSLFKGEIFRNKEVTHTRGRTVDISAAPYSFMEVDGEPVGITPVHIAVIPGGVKVVSNME